ncbi:MAG: GNAT family N-acetyltransferase [Bdellovibrionales bacterium]|nr:GNAT family N-acetyltransferase [Bdellovibrionales bacterium]
MGTPRAPQTDEYNKVIDFLNHNLRSKEGWSIVNEYPLALDNSNLHNIRIIEKDGKIVSHAVIKNLLIKTPIAIFRVAAIGSVVTSPEFRQQGYSQLIVKDCLKLAHDQGADIAILWTDIYDFYRKFGFELAGSETALIFNSPLNSEISNLRYLQSNKVDPHALLRLYSQHSVGSLRNASDIDRYLKIPNSHLYTAWDSENQLQAYAVEGRGADLSNYLHEWGGSVSKLLALIGEIYKQKNEAITLITPSHSITLIRRAKEKGALINEGYLGMIKLVNTKNLFFKIKRFARYIGQDDFIIEFNGQDYIVGHSGHIFRTHSEKDIVQLIFGPHKASQLQSFDIETTQILEKILPIPMWIWGWDSV